MNTVLDVLMNDLEKEIQTIEQHITSGNAKDFAHYRYLSGVLYGVRSAKEIVKDRKDQVENDNE